MSNPQGAQGQPPHIAQATLSPTPLPPNTYSAQRLLEKQHEYQAVSLLLQASSSMLGQVEELAREGEVMARGGAAVGSVLANWPNVFRIIGMCAAAKMLSSGEQQEDEGGEEGVGLEGEVLPRLVRLQVEGLEGGESGSQV
ncbi:hypothetical protein DACRYDRAFT_114416 [Dacryopinax primogenitus]|uniref:DASH complex subunit DAD2 n=1 Tax=Dacryopinax primogenitus (strain DJM 731) TaxID=1858805 RepID=M5G5J0_DACPD|nr:uncharacterized protein DACRYDRAFT_114416 [Dacryopinax primogenitus]EJU03964.1 hypothetical protein DACRYDRAFT_114416 [Dacryopinax primogenitus]